METMLIILTIIVIIGILTLIYVILSANIKANQIKIDEAELVLDDLLNKKYDLLIGAKNIITKETDINHKIFNDLKKLKEQNLSIFNFDRKLNESYSLTEQIKGDFKTLAANDKFNKIIQDIKTIDEKLEATKAFYNKYAKSLNTLIKRFPINLIAKILHIEVKSSFK